MTNFGWLRVAQRRHADALDELRLLETKYLPGDVYSLVDALIPTGLALAGLGRLGEATALAVNAARLATATPGALDVYTRAQLAELLRITETSDDGAEVDLDDAVAEFRMALGATTVG